MSLSSTSREFYEVICIEQLFLKSLKVFHIMDPISRHSAGAVVESTSMRSSILAIECQWVTPFWYPQTVLYDPVFHYSKFWSYLRILKVSFCPLSPRKRKKNVLEPKHRVIPDNCLHLRSAKWNTSDQLLVLQKLRVSDDLYESDIMPEDELARRYTIPIVPDQFPIKVPKEIISVHDHMIAKR